MGGNYFLASPWNKNPQLLTAPKGERVCVYERERANAKGRTSKRVRLARLQQLFSFSLVFFHSHFSIHAIFAIITVQATPTEDSA